MHSVQDTVQLAAPTFTISHVNRNVSGLMTISSAHWKDQGERGRGAGWGAPHMSRPGAGGLAGAWRPLQTEQPGAYCHCTDAGLTLQWPHTLEGVAKPAA